jgi:RNA polymerase-binding transcription factor DksA
MSDSLSAPQLLRIRAKLEAMVADQSNPLRSEQAAAALERMRNGEFGVCVECGDEITPARLAAKPEARLCLDCQTLKDEEDS